MAKNIIPQTPSKVSTLIGLNTHIQGNIEGVGDFKISGTINGCINVEGNVYILKTATVLGNITANDVLVEGTVNGNIFSGGVTRISKSAIVSGNINTRTFLMDSEVSFEGKCSIDEPRTRTASKKNILDK